MSVEIGKSLRDTPNPGSDAAVVAGCTCPVLDNGHGRGYMGVKGVFVYSAACLVHGNKEQPK